MNKSIEEGNDVRMQVFDDFQREFASYSLQLFEMLVSWIFTLDFSL